MLCNLAYCKTKQKWNACIKNLKTKKMKLIQFQTTKRDKACCYQKKSWLRMPSLKSGSVASLVMEGFGLAAESMRFWKREMAEVVGNGLKVNLLSWSCICLVLLLLLTPSDDDSFFLLLDFGVFLVIFKSSIRSKPMKKKMKNNLCLVSEFSI